MKYKWLNNKNNKRLIVFFNGWGMDEAVVSHLEFENDDVLMFYDYNTLETDFDFTLIKTYSETNLIAWSMGVMIATLFDIKYNRKVAINGTLKPIDNNFGIPVKIYDLTVRALSLDGVEQFIQSMYNNSNANIHVKRSFEEQRTELIALKGYKANENFKYNKVLISNNDRIIPTKNQSAYWGIEPNLNAGHAPFMNFKKWSELL